jgi:hypothetical protein
MIHMRKAGRAGERFRRQVFFQGCDTYLEGQRFSWHIDYNLYVPGSSSAAADRYLLCYIPNSILLSPTNLQPPTKATSKQA